jgi:WD40 repeat protein
LNNSYSEQKNYQDYYDVKPNYLYIKKTKTKTNEYYYCCNDGIKLADDISNNILNNKRYIITEKLLKSGIEILDEVLIFKSNKIVSNGVDKLLFFDIKKRKEIETDFKKKEYYSCVYSPNGLTIISVVDKKKDDNKEINKEILLCACKRYLNNQKNGILLVNCQEKEDFKHYFFNTDNFEVYCFCQISIIEKKSVLDTKQDNNSRIDTDYFLVGGYQEKLYKGIIKLYKVNYADNFLDTEIEIKQDIEIEKNNGFKGFYGPISCIAQSSKDGKIFVTCWDGNVYLFDPPNIEYYLKFDELIKNNEFVL